MMASLSEMRRWLAWAGLAACVFAGGNLLDLIQSLRVFAMILLAPLAVRWTLRDPRNAP